MATINIHDATGFVPVALNERNPDWDIVSVRVKNGDGDHIALFFKGWQAVADAANDLANAARVALESSDG